MPAIAAEELPAIFTHADARARGVADRDLYRWRDGGRIEQLARGIYTQPGIPVDADLVEIAVRAPFAILCLMTALARHGLVDDIPPTIDAALPAVSDRPARRRRSPGTASTRTPSRLDAT